MANPQIVALLAERERHVLAGREERVADIDTEIDALKDDDAIETAEAPRASKTRRST